MVNPSPAASARDLKVVFTGPMGAGKTTAIRSLCGSDVLSTEVPMPGPALGDKTSTTVGLDYGEFPLDGGHTLKLFGTPGQDRFRFMWDILAAGAFGLVVLVDNRSADPIAEVERYLEAFAPHVPARRTVVGVGWADSGGPDVAQYCERLALRGCAAPVLEVDVRRDADVRLLLSVLVSMAEVEHE